MSRANRRFVVVIPLATGGVEVHAMKGWLRQHPERIPVGLNPDINTSHQIRFGLRRAGWTDQITAEEVRMFPPGESGESVAVEDVLGEEEESEREDVEAEEAAFALEAQLRDFIASNLGAISIGGPKLSLYADDDGSGIEYRTAVGPIDILAQGSDGALYVFELKRANSPDRAIGQLARYMGALKHRFGNARAIKGVIVAREITQNLRYAIAAFPNVMLFEYRVQFALTPAETLLDEA